MVLGINLITVAACSKVQSFCGGMVEYLRSQNCDLESYRAFAAITCCRLRDFGVVLGINFITVAASREGIVEYLGFQEKERKHEGVKWSRRLATESKSIGNMERSNGAEG